MLDDLAIDANATYINYIVLSALSHGTAAVADCYIDGTTEDGTPLLTTRPSRPSIDQWLPLVPMAMVWAHMAASYTDPTHSIRNSLRATALHLKFEPHLRPSESALIRNAKRKRATRQ